MSGLDLRALRRLRRNVEHEIAVCVRDGLSPAKLLDLLAAVESRIERIGDGDQRPSLARRQQLSAEREPARR